MSFSVSGEVKNKIGFDKVNLTSSKIDLSTKSIKATFLKKYSII